MYNNLYALTDSLFWVDNLLKKEYAGIKIEELLNELGKVRISRSFLPKLTR